MPCGCDQCLNHARTLGLAERAPSKAAIHKAYRDAAKRWHPDRFERDTSLRPQAEEHFKLVQVAYRELTEHQKRPAVAMPADAFAKAAEPPPLTFGNAPGCYTAPHFPAFVYEVISGHLGSGHKPLGIVDLARPGAPGGPFSQFLLLESHAVIVRGTLGIVSLLWYSELGEVRLSDRRSGGKLGFWQRLAERITGPQPNYTLRIDRRNGTHFYSLAGGVDDSVKKVIYNFLLRRKFGTQA
jgi:DnaJ domain